MNTFWLANIVILLGLILASITDLKKREVPDYLNYFLIIFGLFLGALTSLHLWSFWPIISSLTGYAIGYGFGALMYYTGQWGGGDAKMLMAIGAIQGANLYNLFVLGEMPLFFITIITILFAGAIYGMIYIFILIIKYWNKIRVEWAKKLRLKTSIKIRITIIAIVGLILVTSIFVNNYLIEVFLQFFAFTLFIGMHTIFLVDVVEKVCMIKNIPLKDLTEGDWIVKEIKVGKKYICGPKDLGVTLKQIKKLKELKIKNVWVKYGIPFIPGFLIGFIIILILGNWLTYFI